MKKYLVPIIIIIFVVITFYVTNNILSTLKEHDPIMKEIKKSDEKYKIEAMNAEIIGNNIISGKDGKEIDIEETYSKMKKYGTYNETMTTMKEVKPVISIEDNYDKYIISGNRNNSNISLVFIVKEDKYLEKTLSILNNKKVPGTFFIDGSLLEKNISKIKKYNTNEYEILSYNNEYNESFFKTSISYLENISNQKTNYCFTEEENEEVLNLCKKLKKHTIKPIIYLKKNIYKEIKKNLTNSTIISIEINPYINDELPVIIDYIKQKGYNLVTLDNLVKENE